MKEKNPCLGGFSILAATPPHPDEETEVRGGSVLVETSELRPWALNLEPTLTTTTTDQLLALGWFIYKVPPVCSHFWSDFVRLCSHSLVCQALSWVLTGSSPSPIVELVDMPPSLQVLASVVTSGSSLPPRDSDTDSPHTAQPVSQPGHSGVPGARGGVQETVHKARLVGREEVSQQEAGEPGHTQAQPRLSRSIPVPPSLLCYKVGTHRAERAGLVGDPDGTRADLRAPGWHTGGAHPGTASSHS